MTHNLCTPIVARIFCILYPFRSKIAFMRTLERSSGSLGFRAVWPSMSEGGMVDMKRALSFSEAVASGLGRFVEEEKEDEAKYVPLFHSPFISYCTLTSEIRERRKVTYGRNDLGLLISSTRTRFSASVRARRVSFVISKLTHWEEKQRWRKSCWKYPLPWRNAVQSMHAVVRFLLVLDQRRSRSRGMGVKGVIW